jgi:hypothetical protein
MIFGFFQTFEELALFQETHIFIGLRDITIETVPAPAGLFLTG